MIALCCYPNVNGSVRNLSLNTSTAPIFYCSIIPEKIFQYFNIFKCSFTFLSSWKETKNFKSKHASLYCFPSVLQIFGDELNRSSIKAHADIWAQEDWNIWIFQIAFSQWIAPLIKHRFLFFSHLHVRKISTLSIKLFLFFLLQKHLFFCQLIGIYYFSG